MDYNTIKPIQHTIIENKQQAKRYYGKHPYFTTRAWNVVQEYIRHFSQEDDTILDPFGGSGVTGVEALILRRRAIHVDLSPLSVFLARLTALSPIDLVQAGDSFARVQSRCEKQITEWFQTPEREIQGMTIPYWYPENIPLPKNADVRYVHELFTPRQLISLALLRHTIQQEPNVLIRDLLMLVFSATLAKTNRTFVSAAGRKESRGGSAIFSLYRYYVPAKPVELNVWEQFAMRFARVLKAKQDTNLLIGDYYNNQTFRSIHGSATELANYIDEESVDYIFTDPPYGAHIAYLDLSTMWHAWLQMPITDEDRAKEAIENGDVGHTKEEYFRRMNEAFHQMFRVLKYERWLSLVFAHKDASYWNAVVTAAEKAGFEYVNTVPQNPQVVWSVHKKKNPLAVLAGNMILNFRKVKSPTTIAITRVGPDAVDLMKNTAELVIIKNEGKASTDDIINEIVVKLLENGLLGIVKTRIGDIAPFLQEHFVFSELDECWHLPRNFKIGSFIPVTDRIKFYLTDYLRRAAKVNEIATIDHIVMNVLPQLINGDTPEKQTIIGVLKEIAFSADGETWLLKQAETDGTNQLPLFITPEATKALPEIFTPISEEYLSHNSIIYRLAKMGKAAGMQVWIGKKEQSATFNGEKLTQLSLDQFPFTNRELSDYTREHIKQIDVIWLDESHQPTFAFEVEHSTTVKSALERFIEVLRFEPKLAGNLVILAPSKRHRKLNKELTQSTFIGHPLYMETKVTYAFYDDFVNLYDALAQSYKKRDLINKLKAILRRPIVN